MLAIALALLASAAPNDSLMGRGVSHELARYRAAHLSAVRYDLDLNVTRRDTVVGLARVSFTRKGGGDVILDFRGYSLSNVRVNNTPLETPDFNGAHLRLPADKLRDSANVVVLTFRSPIAPAGASVIRFTDDTDKRDYLYTLLVPSDANLLFPCFDQPDLKAVFALDLTVPFGWTALSNGKRLQGDARPQAEQPNPEPTRFRFSPTRPISTYLFAFAAGPYIELREARNDITVFVRAS